MVLVISLLSLTIYAERLASQDNETSQNQKTVIRIMSTFGLFLLISNVSILIIGSFGLFPSSFLKLVAQFRIIVYALTMIGLVLPMIVIVRNTGMKKFVSDSVRFLFFGCQTFGVE